MVKDLSNTLMLSSNQIPLRVGLLIQKDKLQLLLTKEEGLKQDFEDRSFTIVNKI